VSDKINSCHQDLTKNKYTYAGQNKTPPERGLIFLD